MYEKSETPRSYWNIIPDFLNYWFRLVDLVVLVVDWLSHWLVDAPVAPLRWFLDWRMTGKPVNPLKSNQLPNWRSTSRYDISRYLIWCDMVQHHVPTTSVGCSWWGLPQKTTFFRILQVGHVTATSPTCWLRQLITAASIDSKLLQFIFNHKKSSYHYLSRITVSPSTLSSSPKAEPPPKTTPSHEITIPRPPSNLQCRWNCTINCPTCQSAEWFRNVEIPMPMPPKCCSL